MVAAVVGMVPQGLVLLTSIAFGVSAVALARRRVLVQQLPAVEGLARVDVVCFDKTGTLTDGSITFDQLVAVADRAAAEAALGALARDEGNATMAAIKRAFPAPADWRIAAAVPFSSARKWSAASFAGRGTWVLGAPEIVLAAGDCETLAQASASAAAGKRVLALARTDATLTGEALPPNLYAAALVLLAERLRPDATEAIGFFGAQGVALKVISGDSPRTVAAVAAEAGLTQADDAVDARELPDDLGALATVLEQRSVFGRVAPHQKEAMVRALQANGHTVAMTGDGVNDVLALKLADIGVAMGSGASATRAVADLVLLDGDFATLPAVVAEGRRVMANIERVANLFITKTVWATALALVAGLALGEQRTAATIVTLLLSLFVLLLLAMPLTWRRIVLIGALVAGFVLLFPLPVVRRFYELHLPSSYLTSTLPAAAAGVAALTACWLLLRHRGVFGPGSG
jgi:cation-transporting ATPase E